MKLMKFINTRLLIVLGAVLACGLMYEVKGDGCSGGCAAPQGVSFKVTNNTGNTLYVSVCKMNTTSCSPTNTAGNTQFSLSSGLTYTYAVGNNYVYLQKNSTYNNATDYAYQLTSNQVSNGIGAINVWLDSSGHIQVTTLS